MMQSSSKGYLVALSMVLGSIIALPGNMSAAQTAQPTMAKCQRCKGRSLPAGTEKGAYKYMLKQANKTREAVGGDKASAQPGKDIQARGLFSKSATFPSLPHFLHEDSSRLGDMITLLDGSEWGVSERDQATVQDWLVRTPNAPIEIAPNLSFWGRIWGKDPKHLYAIYNMETGGYVETNLSKGPFIHNPHACRIRRLDKEKGEIYLSNGTLWRLEKSGACAEIFKDWQNGDYIIRARNKSWFYFWKYEDVIINVSSGETSTWLPAQRLF